MTAQWHVTDETGEPVTTLAGLAARIEVGEELAAKTLMDNGELFEAAPESLQNEVKAKFKKGDGNPFIGGKKPGGGTPPPIANGSYVSWGNKKGRVDLVVTNGKVPGVSGDVEGTSKTPAARVVVYDSDGKATSEKVGVSTATLKRIPPIKGSMHNQKKSAEPYEALIETLTDYERRVTDEGLPEHARVTGLAVKTVYDRGLEAWPADHTILTAQEWALGRVEHFIKVAAGEVEAKDAGHDTDLLAAEHPVRASEPVAPPPGTEPVEPPPGTEPVDPPGGDTASFVLDAARVEAELKALLEAAD